MMRSLLFTVATATLLLGGSFFQTTDTQRAAAADAIYMKSQQLDLLNQILPVVMTKEQLRKILPPIEKARQRVREISKDEFDEMKPLEAKLDAAIKEAMEKGSVPDKELLNEVGKTYRGIANRRMAIAELNTSEVKGEMVKVLNEGQVKAAANSLNVSQFTNKKPEELTQDQKLDIFVREIMLHPLAYDLLVKLSL